MAFIGKTPSTVFSAASKIQDFTGDGSTVAFDLDYIIPAGGENSLQVFINNIRQKPGSGNSYTLGLDGSNDLKRITFSEAPAAADEIYVIIPVEATNIKNVSDDSVTTAKLADSAVTNAKVSPSAAIADTKLAQITTSSKVATSAIVQPGSPGVYLDGAGSWSAIDTTQQDTNAFNIGLLGFKMAVNEGLTVFNLVDGVVDEFNDESGTDEAEGTNDNYCATSDFYANSNPVTGPLAALSAGFTTTTVTEPDTSTAGTNPAIGSGTYGTFTVPTGYTSLNVYAWGAGGGGSTYPMASPNMSADGGGGGFATGTLAVTSGQSFTVVVGEGGRGNATCTSGPHPGSLGGGGGFGPSASSTCNPMKSGGGGLSGIFNSGVPTTAPNATVNGTAPQAILIGAGGGGTGYPGNGIPTETSGNGGAGGGLIGDAGGTTTEQTDSSSNGSSPEASAGGGGSQTVGGQGGCAAGATGQTGFLFQGGSSGGLAPSAAYSGTGGSGYYGGGGGSYPQGPGAGGGGSSFHGHPQITCGSTEEGSVSAGGGTANPNYVAGTNEGYNASPTGEPTPASIDAQAGEDGYVLLAATGSCASVTSTTIISNAFTSTSVPTNARIVVFEENVDTPTLNTDIIASVSRDGTNFTNATLSDSGYVTGSSGQRILTGQVDISGQPSGQSMRWKLALANNQVRIHGVSLQWD